ncbi:MAG: DUF92 domain-containing protein [Firmicutes bacterium]|nr:DUF92 domain-containing protein [Bacillota bacterium]
MVVSLLLAAFLAAAVVLPALRWRWLSPSGALAAFVVGWVTFGAGGWQAATVLLTFFVTSSAFSRWHAGRKRRMELLTAPAGGSAGDRQRRCCYGVHRCVRFDGRLSLVDGFRRGVRRRQCGHV